MTNRREVPGIRKYDGPAGGWGALRATADAVRTQMETIEAPIVLMRTNQPDGFDCPGCAWPDKEHKSTFQFCENGAKAVTWEATTKRVTPEFFAANTVSSLLRMSDYELENMGRLTHPLVYDRATDTFRAIEWDDAFARIGEVLRALPPDQVEFYTSGRASNEAAYLYQLFARELGTNNFPDCSNMCHEPTSVGLPQSIGIGKGTVSLEDFDHCELIISIGHNPGTNHPRMMGTLHECARRNVPIIVFNPLRERALERFADPQDMIEMASFGSTRIASTYYQVDAGGDAAALKGIMKALLQLEAERGNVLDRDFIAQHTNGFDAFSADLEATSWDDIERASGLSQAQLEQVALAYAKSNATIVTYGMGVTQHNKGTATVRLIADLLLMRGNIGKPGAGVCPLRGHSNVQGNRTVGIEEKPSQAFLDRLGHVFDFEPPRHHGYDVVETIEGMLEGHVKVLIGLGGNFAMATPDTPRTWEGMRRCDLSVHITTKLNRSHLIHGRDALILPTLGRTEIDLQNNVAQGVTVEDSMSMVHVSYGMNKPASPNLMSEPAIVAHMGHALFGSGKIDWLAYKDDYAKIRDAIEATLDGFYDYNTRIARPGGFHLRVASRDREWLTPTGKANFIAHALPADTPIQRARALHGERLMTLMTTRSHDQYNTTVYGLDDRYRGVFGQRRVVFANRDDLAMLGLKAGDWVDMETVWHDGIERRADGFLLVEYDIPRGCIGAYYPETNPLVPLDSVGDVCNTPTSKSIPVLLHRAAAPASIAA